MPFPLYPLQTIIHWLMIKLLSRHRLLHLVVEGYVIHINPNGVWLLTNDSQKNIWAWGVVFVKNMMF